MGTAGRTAILCRAARDAATTVVRDFCESLQLGKETMARTRIPVSAAEEAARLLKERLELSTAEIGLTVRTTNCLEERGIFTVRELLKCRPEDLLDITNFGEKTLEEVYGALAKMGFVRQKRRTA